MLEVHHDAVVRCHDLLTGDDGRVYLVMEMVEGPSLSDWIREGPLSEARCGCWAPESLPASLRRIAAAWSIATSPPTTSCSPREDRIEPS